MSRTVVVSWGGPRRLLIIVNLKWRIPAVFGTEEDEKRHGKITRDRVSMGSILRRYSDKNNKHFPIATKFFLWSTEGRVFSKDDFSSLILLRSFIQRRETNRKCKISISSVTSFAANYPISCLQNALRAMRMQCLFVSHVDWNHLLCRLNTIPHTKVIPPKIATYG